MGMKDTLWIDKINSIFLPLAATAIHISMLAWNIGMFRLQPEFGPDGEAQYHCNTRNINQMVNTAWPDAFHHRTIDFCTSLPEVEPKKMDKIQSIVCRRMNSTGVTLGGPP
jgi:hypothetical protein